MQLENIKGIGPKTVNILKRLGINDSNDLLTYYPYRFEFIKRTDMDRNDLDKVIIDGIVETNAVVTYLRGHKDKMDFKLNIGSKLINVSIFNRGFLKNKIVVGSKVTVFGKYDKKRNTVVASDIKFSLLPDRTIIEPVYHITTGINNSQLNNIIKSVDERYSDRKWREYR